MRDVEPLVALEPDQPRVEDAGERLRRLGLADAGLALEQERLLELEREEQRGREAAVGEVRRVAERDFELVDRREGHARTLETERRETAREREVVVRGG